MIHLKSHTKISRVFETTDENEAQKFAIMFKGIFAEITPNLWIVFF